MFHIYLYHLFTKYIDMIQNDIRPLFFFNWAQVGSCQSHLVQVHPGPVETLGFFSFEVDPSLHPAVRNPEADEKKLATLLNCKRL